ncbi:MAG: acyl carrier protein [Solirubrobacterales bacterium]
MRDLIVENSSLEAGTIDSDSADLFAAGLSSLDCVRILLAIEDEFDIELPEDVINRELFSTVEKLSAAVTNAVGSGV